MPRYSPAGRTLFALAFSICSLATAVHSAAAKDRDNVLFYVGTYTRGDSLGIYPMRLNLAEGTLSAAGQPTQAENPSFLALHPGGKYLYAVNETGNFQGEKTGAVSAFEIVDDQGNLKLLNQQPSQGTSPCHLVVDPTGRHVLVANYGGGNVVSLPIDSQGKLGPVVSNQQHEGTGGDPRRQKGPHAHAIVLERSGKLALAADLGIDKVMLYDFDRQSGKLTAHSPPAAKLPPGSGPRHIALHPGGKFVYVNNELNMTVTALAWDEEQRGLKKLQTLPTLPREPAAGDSTAEIAVHPSGKFLYVSNRGHDTLAIYTIDQQTGKLAPVGHQQIHGKTPRSFAIDPTGKYLIAAGQSSHTLSLFAIDPQTGKLRFTGAKAVISDPVCVLFTPVGK